MIDVDDTMTARTWPIIKRDPTGNIVHRCHFTITSIAADRITPWPVRLAIELVTYKCECGKTHSVESGYVVRQRHTDTKRVQS